MSAECSPHVRGDGPIKQSLPIKPVGQQEDPGHPPGPPLSPSPMKLCSWCEREGRRTTLGPGVGHGICAMHAARLAPREADMPPCRSCDYPCHAEIVAYAPDLVETGCEDCRCRACWCGTHTRAPINDHGERVVCPDCLAEEAADRRVSERIEERRCKQ